MNMTIQEVYEKFKHMDTLLSDKEVLGDDVQNMILYELWQTVKAAATNAERTYTTYTRATTLDAEAMAERKRREAQTWQAPQRVT